MDAEMGGNSERVEAMPLSVLLVHGPVDYMKFSVSSFFTRFVNVYCSIPDG